MLFRIAEPIPAGVGLPLGFAACVVYRSKKSATTVIQVKHPSLIERATNKTASRSCW